MSPKSSLNLENKNYQQGNIRPLQHFYCLGLLKVLRNSTQICQTTAQNFLDIIRCSLKPNTVLQDLKWNVTQNSIIGTLILKYNLKSE